MVDADVTSFSESDRTWLHQHLTAAVVELPRPIGRVTIRVVADATMVELHWRHRGDASTTDVLTFPDIAADDPRVDPSVGPIPGPELEPELDPVLEADIAICADEAARIAATLGHATREELLLYALHGLLHCCGHDDGDDAAFAAMHAEEDRILDAIGIGAVFNRGVGSAEDDGSCDDASSDNGSCDNGAVAGGST